MENKILIDHGNGGLYTQQLIKDVFQSYFNNDILNKMNDSAIFVTPTEKLAFSTDSFVVTPLFFPGGDIGKLAVYGTVNDLAVSGAKPLYLSAGFIIEEGLSIKELALISASMAFAAQKAEVKIITGDTKVVPKGAADKLFINTTGIGAILPGIELSINNVRPGDKIIITGSMGEHGLAIMLAREKMMSTTTEITSDCAPLNKLTERLLTSIPGVKLLRDPTRGGVATVLNELAVQCCLGIELIEKQLPITQTVSSICDLLGLDPLYLANEGKFIAVVSSEAEKEALQVLGEKSTVIGEITNTPPGKVYIKTGIGGKRILNTLITDPLPRIC